MIFYLFQFMANKVMILHYKTKTQYSNTKEKEIYGTIGDLQWNLRNGNVLFGKLHEMCKGLWSFFS